MKFLDIKDIQKYELDILLRFVEICEKNNLRYYLSGGTLLGAIRHKGFIPWDDDIDLAMPRSDYIKLIDISKEYKSDTYTFLLFNENDERKSILPYGKFLNKKTFIKSQYNNNIDIKHLWIDIIPMDGLPEDIREVKKIYQKAEFYRKIISLCDARLGQGKNFIRKFIKYCLKPMAVLYGKERAIKNLNRVSTTYNYDTSKYVGAISWGLYGVNERMLKKEVDMIVKVQFESSFFVSFSCWDSYLGSLYGNYMELPPENRRKTHDMIVWTE